MAIRLGIEVPPSDALTFFDYSLHVEPSDLWSVHVMGQPGFGKSTFLGNLAEQFADAGEGVLLIDVKGDLANQVAARTKHPERVIYLDPADANLHDRFWTLNPLEFDRTNRLDFEVYANALFDIFVYIGGVDPLIMVKIKKIMTEAIRLALARRDTTITDIYLIIHDETHRAGFLSSPSVPPMTRDYWERIFPASERDRRLEVDTTDTRIRDITAGPYLSYLLNQPQGNLHLTRWLDAGKLVICNFDQGRLSPQTAQKLGNLFLGYLATQIIRRPQGQQAPPWRLIVDEFTEMATLPLVKMITQMRTYSAYPVFANQNRKQLERVGEMLAAADQADVKVELQLSELDAEVTKRRFGAEAATASLAMEEYTARVRFSRSPQDTARRQTIRLLPWMEPEQEGQLEAIKAASLTLATPKRDLRTLFDFARFARATHKGEVRAPAKPRAKRTAPHAPPAPGAHPPQTRVDEASSRPDRVDPAGLSGAGEPRPASVHDLLAGGQSLLPQPTQPTRGPAQPVSSPQSGQRRLPEPPQRSGAGRGGPLPDPARQNDVGPPRTQRPDTSRPRRLGESQD